MNLYDKFISEYGKEILEDIAESLWHREDFGSVEVNDIHEINRTNHTVSGLFKHKGKDIYFSMNMGDEDGTHIHYYSEEYQEVKHARTVWSYSIKHENKLDGHMKKTLYGAVKENKYLQDILKDYAYDMYVTGNGAKIKQYYRDKLNKHPWGKDLDFVAETVYE